MTRDSDGGRPQKTVAELLAEHGGQVGGAPRRRRRRAAEDDDAPRQPGERSISDTAPQAIIDRVRSEGPPPAEPRNGAAPAPEQGEPQPPARRRPPRAVPPAPAQGTGGYPVPPPEDAGRPPLPPRQANGVPPANGVAPPANGVAPPAGGVAPPPAEQHDRRSATRRVPPVAPSSPPEPPPTAEGTLAARLDGLGEAPAPEQPPQPPPAPPQGTGGFGLPPRRRRPPRGAPPPPPEPNTEQFPAVAGPEATPADAGPAADEPPAGLAGWRMRKRDAQLEDTEVGVMPAVPPGGPPGHAPAPQGRPGEDADEGPPTGFYVPNFDDEDADGAGAPFRTGVLDDDPLGEGGRDPAYDDPYDESYGDYEADDEDYGDYEDEPAEEAEYADEEASPAKQWLALAGQLALGVAGGAAVWLGFNWLWGQLPAAALVAALVATVGLVWIVRKVRRAEDLQTTVLALLVGLVVTVSPAALLLVSR
ncbi:hypothetical protein [Prauserella muralis]|uniref:Uncharacterized protein n=1 Tax=Prauserella muralis TaxID=588067 RepID=A0A2V4B9B1_9PSEU|nr:hypothetical protein [Prauserella muralis]PXY32005.1 hypothetical protein BAY60_06715 [Prauserella muralis]TWE13560.1 hypothetical protein FHX69_5684 [Prauserella muralis]